jgi:hypothetical protein
MDKTLETSQSAFKSRVMRAATCHFAGAKKILHCNKICKKIYLFPQYVLTPEKQGINNNHPKRFGNDGDRKALGTINDLEYHREDI